MNPKTSRRKFLKYYITAILLSSTISFDDNEALAYQPTKIVVEKVNLKINNLPVEFENFTIAQISDLHRGNIVESWLIEKVISMTNDLKADCIVITGDSANNLNHLSECCDKLNKLSASYGTYCVMGNWEMAYGYQNSLNIFNKSNIKVLSNSFTLIEKNGSKINLAGIDDDKGFGNTLEQTFSNINDKNVTILLSHNPYVIAKRQKALKRIDVVMSGHTHGGQVVYPIIGAVKKQTKFGLSLLSGLYNFNETQLYINRGIGVVHYPYRINCPPEITFYTLKNKV